MPKEQSFPKERRLLRSRQFRTVYDQGTRISGPLFTAFILPVEPREGPKVGFTTPRALGKSVVRNRLRRRVREAVRRELWRLDARWHVVFNPRRAALDASWEQIVRDVVRIFERCGRS